MSESRIPLRLRLFAGFTLAAWVSLLGTKAAQRETLAFMAEHFEAFYGRGARDD